MLHTYLTEQLGLRYPIVGAPMGGVAGGKLARAISVAGGLGMFGIGKSTALSFIEEESAIARGDDNGRFGLGLVIWAIEQRPELLDAAMRARPTLISLSFGPPAAFVERIHRAGILVAVQVNSVAAATVAEQSGVDMIVAQGAEAGGHSNVVEVGTLPLLQAVLDAVHTPVLAAGGIATPRGLAAVLAAGAEGAWIGTAFLACLECANTSEARRRIISAHETDTVLTHAFDRAQSLAWPPQHPGRALCNRFADEWHGHSEELVGNGAAAEQYRQAQEAGDYDVAVIYAGQAVGSVKRQRPAAEVVQEIGEGAETLLGRWCADDPRISRP